jgi:hypothetical protein
LKLYAHRTYKQKVSEHDQKYIDDLLLYLLERSKDFPDEVFHQLSNLSVGPVITEAVESMAMSEFLRAEYFSDFLPCAD